MGVVRTKTLQLDVYVLQLYFSFIRTINDKKGFLYLIIVLFVNLAVALNEHI